MSTPIAQYETYKRIKLLGEGSFGKAYLVENVTNGSICVLKQVDLNKMSESEKKDTLKEARILEVMNHPNIVRFREVYLTKKGRLCIVMDYADGGDLTKKIKEMRGQYFSENQILDWFTQICLGLKHVHDRKVIHRDLKAQNIFLTKTNIIKLGDFGIAKVLNNTRENAKTMVGTPYYLSPEIISNKGYNFKSDIWSLGVVLYELCTLRPPFDASSLSGLASKIVKGQYSPLPYQFSKDLKELVGILLQVDPSKRPTINNILSMPLIKNRIKTFLTENVRMTEFSHTILHKQNLVKPAGRLEDLKKVNNEEPLPAHMVQKLKQQEVNIKPNDPVLQKPPAPIVPVQNSKPPSNISTPTNNNNNNNNPKPVLFRNNPSPLRNVVQQTPPRREEAKPNYHFVGNQAQAQPQVQYNQQQQPPQNIGQKLIDGKNEKYQAPVFSRPNDAKLIPENKNLNNLPTPNIKDIGFARNPSNDGKQQQQQLNSNFAEKPPALKPVSDYNSEPVIKNKWFLKENKDQEAKFNILTPNNDVKVNNVENPQPLQIRNKWFDGNEQPKLGIDIPKIQNNLELYRKDNNTPRNQQGNVVSTPTNKDNKKVPNTPSSISKETPYNMAARDGIGKTPLSRDNSKNALHNDNLVKERYPTPSGRGNAIDSERKKYEEEKARKERLLAEEQRKKALEQHEKETRERMEKEKLREEEAKRKLRAQLNFLRDDKERPNINQDPKTDLSKIKKSNDSSKVNSSFDIPPKNVDKSQDAQPVKIDNNLKKIPYKPPIAEERKASPFTKIDKYSCEILPLSKAKLGMDEGAVKSERNIDSVPNVKNSVDGLYKLQRKNSRGNIASDDISMNDLITHNALIKELTIVLNNPKKLEDGNDNDDYSPAEKGGKDENIKDSELRDDDDDDDDDSFELPKNDKDNQKKNKNNKASDFNEIESMRMSIEHQLGFENFKRAYNIFKSLISKESLDSIEKKYKRQDHYGALIPFISLITREKYLPLVIQLIVMEDSN